MAKPKQETIEVGTVQKRDDIKIVASLTHYRNELYVDFREYVESDTYQGPTRKGIRFHHEAWEDFKKLVDSVDKKLHELS